MFGVDVGTILDGSEASIKALHGYLSPGRHQIFWESFPKLGEQELV